MWRVLLDYEDLVPSSLAESWSDFIDEVAQCWDTSTDLPRIAGDRPDLRCCLLHQKLQLLNICIRKRREKAQKKRHAPPPGTRRVNSRSGNSSRGGSRRSRGGGGGGFPERMTTVKPIDLWDGELANDHERDHDGGGGNESDSWGDFDLITGSGASSKNSTLKADPPGAADLVSSKKDVVSSTRVRFRGSGSGRSSPLAAKSEDGAAAAVPMKVSYSDASQSDSEASLSDFFDVQEKDTEDDILPGNRSTGASSGP